MGLFEDFDIDMDDVKEASGFTAIPDGPYEWEITEAGIRYGTPKKPDHTYFVITYDLDEAGQNLEWFVVAVDGDAQHTDAKKSLPYLKKRLIELGVEASRLNEFDGEELVGITGTFRLVTTKNPKGEFQNIRNFAVGKAGAPDEAPDEEVWATPSAEKTYADKEAADAEAKKRVAANRRARAAAPKDEEDQGNPFDND